MSSEHELLFPPRNSLDFDFDALCDAIRRTKVCLPAFDSIHCVARLRRYQRSSGTAASTERFRKPLPATLFWWEGGGPKHTFFAAPDSCPLRGSLAAGEREVDLDLRLNLDPLAVQQIGLILPLLHSFDRSGRQHRVSADQT